MNNDFPYGLPIAVVDEAEGQLICPEDRKSFFVTLACLSLLVGTAYYLGLLPDVQASKHFRWQHWMFVAFLNGFTPIIFIQLFLRRDFRNPGLPDNFYGGALGVLTVLFVVVACWVCKHSAYLPGMAGGIIGYVLAIVFVNTKFFQEFVRPCLSHPWSTLQGDFEVSGRK